MPGRAAKTTIEGDEHTVSTNFRELFRYRKAGRTRIYNLLLLADESELWTVSEQRGRIVKSQKKVTFDDPDDIAPFLEDVQRELRAGGWRQS